VIRAGVVSSSCRDRESGICSDLRLRQRARVRLKIGQQPAQRGPVVGFDEVTFEPLLWPRIDLANSRLRVRAIDMALHGNRRRGRCGSGHRQPHQEFAAFVPTGALHLKLAAVQFSVPFACDCPIPAR
jgi:hypothetical protein